MGAPIRFPQRRVILFDVDGTLLKAGGAGRDAFIHSWESVFGTPQPFDGVSFAGRTDPWIFREAANKALGRPPTGDNEAAFIERYC